MKEINVSVKVPEVCGAGCSFCDDDYGRFTGYCSLFTCELKMNGQSKGHKGGSNIYIRAEECQRAIDRGEAQ